MIQELTILKYLSTLDPFTMILCAIIIVLSLIVRYLMRFFTARGMTEKEVLRDLYEMYKDLSTECKRLDREVSHLKIQCYNLKKGLIVAVNVLESWKNNGSPSEKQIKDLKEKLGNIIEKN